MLAAGEGREDVGEGDLEEDGREDNVVEEGREDLDKKVLEEEGIQDGVVDVQEAPDNVVVAGQ